MPAKRISLTWLFPPVAAKEHTGTAAITSAMVEKHQDMSKLFFHNNPPFVYYYVSYR